MAVIHRSPHDEYYSVDIIPCQRTKIPVRAYHDQFGELRGKITMDIETLSKVFVGTGDYEMDVQGIYQPFARTGGKVVIPGTCIKGVIRTYAEALSSSCEGGACRADREGACICCRIFGALGFQGRVTFCDTAPLEPAGVTLIYPMRVRWSGGFKGGRRFYYHSKPNTPRAIDERTQRVIQRNEERVETVSEHAHFTCDAFFENLNQTEIGLLLLAMGCSPNYPFNLKLGGGKNRRLGSIRIDLLKGIQVVSSNAYFSFHPAFESKQLSDWGKLAVEAYTNSLNPTQRNVVLENIRVFQTDAAPSTSEEE